MPLEVVYGESRDRERASVLAENLARIVDDGTAYLAYPLLATADETIEVDALLVSRAHGLVAFLLPEAPPEDGAGWIAARQTQDRLYSALEAHLRRYEGLRDGRKLALEPATATVFPTHVADMLESERGAFYGEMSDVEAFILELPAIDASVERNLQAALQRVSTIKPIKKRSRVGRTDSRGAKLKEIEKGIANLDRWQKAAAIESPEGPQRIRGLAGSGKTVVLALKAAYWHVKHPEWRIALTFHSRSLYQQIEDLVTRFTFDQSNDRPDLDHLRIIHSWGSRGKPGVYSLIAAAMGEIPRDFSYAAGHWGSDGAFQGVCRELLDLANRSHIEPIFDAVLIDEAQDLPPEFFQLIHMFTREPKRIVWGFDEFQKLSEAAMPNTDDLFGRTPSGQSLVSLQSGPKAPRRDIVLPVCYRNTPWALATAHALGVGVYRNGGLVQHPDEAKLWHEVGYETVYGRLEDGAEVTLQRRPDSYPEYFNRLLNSDDAVVFETFADEEEQDRWIASQVVRNLKEDELEPDDILIVLPDTYRAKTRGPRLMRELQSAGVQCHQVGVTSNSDNFTIPGSVAIAQIYRAKGNEAPMVYVADAHYAASEVNAITRRNTLFTAITRSRAWVRVTGYGSAMQLISDEASAVRNRGFKLSFRVPTESDLRIMRRQHRDRTAEDAETLRRAQEGLTTFLAAVAEGTVDLQDMPPSLRTQLISSLRSEAGDDDS